jgi:hypothetical protein
MNYFIDSETCGLHSMMVLFQYAEDDGPIQLYNIWKEPVWKTLELFERIADGTVIGFNLSFDWFHIVKIYTIWSLLPRDWIPEEHIDEIALKEPEGRDGPCIKPRSACDLLLHSRKNEYQALMGRKDIRIRRVPTPLAYALAEELEKRIELDGIFFAKSKDQDAPKWKVYDIFKHGDLDTDFKDVVLKFNPAGGLKFLAEYAMGFAPRFHFEDVELDTSHRPVEYGYAPMALSVSTPELEWAVWEHQEGKDPRITGHAWPGKIRAHIEHWANHQDAREYASDDILYTRALYDHFKRPTPGDDDSTLACMVPVVRWRGFRINVEGMKELLVEAKAVVANSPVNINRPQEVRAYMEVCMDDVEASFIEESTEKQRLETIQNSWVIKNEEECTLCYPNAKPDCKRCNGTGVLKPGPHPASKRAKEILTVKFAAKEIELYEKLIHAGRFHASFNVIGTMSSRMAGGDGLNAQGIKKTKEVRMMFPLAWEGYELCGGDFDSFEVCLADAVYNDPQLRKALTTFLPCHKCNATGKVKPCKPCNGRGCDLCVDKDLVECGNCEGTGEATKKIHGLFGMALYPGMTYEEILASDGSKVLDMYTKAKSGVFAMIYGGNAETLTRNLSIPKDVAEEAFDGWGKMFPGIGRARQRIERSFCSMKQVDGRQVVWEEPADYCETFLGFRRYFTLENRICKELFALAQKPPKEWRNCPIKLVRSKINPRVQTAAGAASSAVYGAAFSVQQANMRAAANHEIQSPGGEITKRVQRLIWDLQPHGVHPLYVAPMNIHDELEVVTHPDYVERVAEAVRTGVESFRSKVALIGMTWNKAMANWAEKKAGTETLKIKPPELMQKAGSSGSNQA